MWASILTRPDDWEEALRSRSGDHDEDVLSNRLLDSDEEDIADDLHYLNSQSGDPQIETAGVDEVGQRQ